jgi:hypothetical protein
VDSGADVEPCGIADAAAWRGGGFPHEGGWPRLVAVAPIGLNTVPAGAPPGCPALRTQDRKLFRSDRSIHPDEDVQVA